MMIIASQLYLLMEPLLWSKIFLSCGDQNVRMRIHFALSKPSFGVGRAFCPLVVEVSYGFSDQDSKTQKKPVHLFLFMVPHLSVQIHILKENHASRMLPLAYDLWSVLQEKQFRWYTLRLGGEKALDLVGFLLSCLCLVLLLRSHLSQNCLWWLLWARDVFFGKSQNYSRPLHHQMPCFPVEAHALPHTCLTKRLSPHAEIQQSGFGSKIAMPAKM
jgi:hypothetical protein